MIIVTLSMTVRRGVMNSRIRSEECSSLRGMNRVALVTVCMRILRTKISLPLWRSGKHGSISRHTFVRTIIGGYSS
jgi:hypothetical protein